MLAMRATTRPDRSTVRSLIAGEVRAELARQQISGVELARRLGGTQSYWQRRISGAHPLDVEDLAALADLLQVPVSKFWVSANRSLSDGSQPTLAIAYSPLTLVDAA
jgi:transcriptional regulator with XRE-family HTH domain